MMRRFSSRLLTAAGLGLALAGVTGGAAHAFGAGDCTMFAQSNVARVQEISINTNNADFGDFPHLFGAPLGKAIICWGADGRVGVRGTLFADDFREPIQAILKVRYQAADGTWTPFARGDVIGQGGLVAFQRFVHTSPRGRFNRVQIRLETFQDSPLPNDQAVRVANQVFRR
ncbi:hypothetical protein [Xanthobacter wiegelii]|uniref:hypothetical protein n=2 Tax=Xanthobacter wiegelii TaxID=3119913 RepID=UPI00372B0ED5